MRANLLRQIVEPAAPPRPRPAGRPAMHHQWHDLLFLHWEVPPPWVQERLPAGLLVDTFHGRAHVGIVCFKMRGTRPWWAPAIPGLSDFLEMNVRVYCHDGAGRHGVYFLSLDCHQPLAVWGARALWSLNYRLASMSTRPHEDGWHFSARRRGQAEAARFAWTHDGPPAPTRPGTLEHFLVDRWLLFVRRGGRLLSGEVHHPPYRVSAARLAEHTSLPIAWNGAAAPDGPPVSALCCPGKVAVEVFGLRPTGG